MARSRLQFESKDLNKLIKKFGSLSPRIAARVDQAYAAAAAEVEEKAINDVSVDEAILRNSITTQRIGFMSYEVTASASHAPYVEWGTKTKVNVPSELQSYAAQFKGGGAGDYYDFLNAILDWVKRKGIVSRYSVKTKKEITRYSKADNERLIETAQAIAFSILRNGIEPRPFFFKNFYPAVPKVKKEIKRIIQEELRKN